MRIIETKVYTYDELNDKAKAKARDWYREGAFDYDWYEQEKEYFEDFLKQIGFINVKSQFTGFYQQGDGASFDFKAIDFDLLINAAPDTYVGQYVTSLEAWRAANATLIRKIKRLLPYVTARSGTNSYASHYCHENTRHAHVEIDAPNQNALKRVYKLVNELEIALTILMRSLSIDYYKALEACWDDLNSDALVTDSILANEYTFTEDGKRFG
jgi:hypothetical protein